MNDKKNHNFYLIFVQDSLYYIKQQLKVKHYENKTPTIESYLCP